MDYYKVLRLYMKHVLEQEGVTYAEPYREHDLLAQGLEPVEVRELLALSGALLDEAAERDKKEEEA